MAHHAADLPAAHADGAHHADLAGALEHREHERVDHPEQADDDRQREEHVEEHQELLQVLAAEVDPAGARVGVDVGELRYGAVDAGGSRGVRAIGRAHEHVEVAWSGEAGVERGLRDEHVAGQVAPRVGDRDDPDGEGAAGRGGDRQVAADPEAVVVRESLCDDRAGAAETRDDRVGACAVALLDAGREGRRRCRRR